MSRLRTRLQKLEGKGAGVRVVFADRERITAEERRQIADKYRREHRLPEETAVVVFDRREAEL